MSTLALGHNLIDTDSTLRITVGSRGVALFISQDVCSSNSDNPVQTQFAGKVLSHEQALDLRDLLNKQYPDNYERDYEQV